mgnify:CR=1 FL=1
MWEYVSSFLYSEPKVYELEPDPVLIRCDGKKNEEEKIPYDDPSWELRDPYPILEIIVNNKYLKREIGYFFNWNNVTAERLSSLNKSFKYWIAFVNVSSLYLNTPKINYKSNVYYVEFWENYYKNS